MLRWLAVLALASPALAVNGVRNPGFEAGLDGWDTVGKGVAIDEAVAHSGKRSLRVTGDSLQATTGAHQAMRFDPPVTRTLRLSGWSRAEGVEVKGGCVLLVDGQYTDGTKLEQQAIRFDPGTHGWQYREIEIEADQPLRVLDVVPLLAEGKGMAWFDDIAVSPVPVAFRAVRTVTGLFGGGGVGLVADMAAPAKWNLEMNRRGTVVAAASGDASPVTFQWTGAAGDYTVRITAPDPIEGTTAEEVRTLHVPGGTRSAYTAWIESSMKRVMPQALPERPGAPLAARVSLAANEYESFQICLLAAPGAVVHTVRLEASDLVSRTGGRIAASEIEWQQVGFVRVELLRPASRTGSQWPGWWPDPLLPVKSFDLRPGFTQPVWVTVHAPAGTPAGEYAGTIRIAAGHEPSRAVPVRVRVYGFELPPVSHLKTAFALMDDDLAHLYGRPLAADVRRRFGDFVLRHRLNADDIYRTRVPEIEDLKHYDGHGLQGFNAAYLIPERVSQIGDVSAYTPDLLNGFFQRLDPFLAKLRQAGMAKRVYVYGFDELDPPFFPAMRDYFGALKQRYPEMRTMTTAHLPLDAKTLGELHVDMAVPLTRVYDFDKAEQCRRAGFQVWGYVACGPREPYANFLADDPLVEARVLWWQAYQQKMDGFLYWGVDVWQRRGNDRPIDPARGPLLDWVVTTGRPTDDEWRDLHGDGLLVYAGVDGPIGSIRLANIRDGLEDYEYLWLLARKKGVGAARAECRSVTRGLTDFTRDPAVVYAQREEIAWQIGGR